MGILVVLGNRGLRLRGWALGVLGVLGLGWGLGVEVLGETLRSHLTFTSHWPQVTLPNHGLRFGVDSLGFEFEGTGVGCGGWGKGEG